MKKTCLTLILVCFSILVFCQSQRLILNEEFTQVYCGGCIEQNPKFDLLLKANSTKIVSIKYQVYWPGTDFMHNDNPTQADARTTYYNPGYAPKIYFDGKCKAGNYAMPYYATQHDIDSAYAVPSPFDMTLSSYISSNGDSIYIKAKIKATMAISGNLKAMIVVVENRIQPDINIVVHDTIQNYWDIMKRMIPTEQGTSLPSSFAVGDSAIVNVSWKLTKIYDYPELAVVGFVQDYTTKTVHQSAYSKPFVPFRMALTSTDCPDRIVKFVSSNGTASFSADFTTFKSTSGTYRFKLDKSALPAGSTASMVINSITYPDSVDLTISALETKTFSLKVNSGPNANMKGFVSILVNDINSFQAYKKTRSFIFYSDVTTLVINRGFSLTDITSVTAALSATTNPYVQMGSDFYDNFEIRMIDTSTIKKANLDHIVINGSSFSSGDLVPDKTIIAINSFLNSGGNLFITGNRIGASGNIPGYSTQMYKDFFNNILGATWLSNTSSSVTPLNIIASDPIFGNLASSTLKTGTYYGEHVNPNGSNSLALVSYSSPTDYCAIRNNNSSKNWKTVYLGVSYNEISGTAFKNEFIDRAIDWFDGLTGVLESDESDHAILGQNYPNPASLNTSIPIEKLTIDAVLNISNMVGKNILTIKINAGKESVNVDLGNFCTGIYYYKLCDGNKIQTVKKMVVVK